MQMRTLASAVGFAVVVSANVWDGYLKLDPKGCENCYVSADPCFGAGCEFIELKGTEEDYFNLTTWKTDTWSECDPAGPCLPCYVDPTGCGFDPFPKVCSQPEISDCLYGDACHELIPCEGEQCFELDVGQSYVYGGEGFPIQNPEGDWAQCNSYTFFTDDERKDQNHSFYGCAKRHDGNKFSGFGFSAMLGCGLCQQNLVYKAWNKTAAAKKPCMALIENPNEADVCSCLDHIPDYEAKQWMNCIMPVEGGWPKFNGVQKNLLEQYLECNYVPFATVTFTTTETTAPRLSVYDQNNLGRGIFNRLEKIGINTTISLHASTKRDDPGTYTTTVQIRHDMLPVYGSHLHENMTNFETSLKSWLKSSKRSDEMRALQLKATIESFSTGAPSVMPEEFSAARGIAKPMMLSLLLVSLVTWLLF